MVPVAMQLTFPIVWEFNERLSEGNMRQVFMADTMTTDSSFVGCYEIYIQEMFNLDKNQGKNKGTQEVKQDEEELKVLINKFSD